MSKLTEVSVYHKPMERHFSDLFKGNFGYFAYTATINYPSMRNVDGREYTAAFIKTVVNCWILSGKTSFITRICQN